MAKHGTSVHIIYTPLAHLPYCTLFVPPKFWIIFVCHFSWVLQPSQEKLKTMLMQNVGGGEGGGKKGSLWEMCKWRIYVFFENIYFFLSVACSHSRATQYFIASVHGSCSWTAYPCNSYVSFRLGRCRACKGACSSMGFDADRTKKTGKFYLKTHRSSPFCGKFSSQKT